jgi:hypothetical protein
MPWRMRASQGIFIKQKFEIVWNDQHTKLDLIQNDYSIINSFLLMELSPVLIFTTYNPGAKSSTSTSRLCIPT